MPRRLSSPVSASWSARWRSWSSRLRRSVMSWTCSEDVDRRAVVVAHDRGAQRDPDRVAVGVDDAQLGGHAVVGQQRRRRPRRRDPRRRGAAAPRGAARRAPGRAAGDGGQRRVDALDAAVDADQRHADRGAVEGDLEAPLGLAAGALGDALLGDVARDEDDALDGAVGGAHRRALHDDGAPRERPGRLHASLLARPARWRRSARWRRAARRGRSPKRGARPSRLRRCRRALQVCALQQQAAQVRSKRPTEAPGRCCSTSRWRRSESRRASSAARHGSRRLSGWASARIAAAGLEGRSHPMVIGGARRVLQCSGALCERAAAARSRSATASGSVRNGEWSLSRRCVVPACAAIASCAGTGIALSRSQMT